MKTKNTSSKSIDKNKTTHHPERTLRLPDLSIPLCLGVFTLVYFLLEWGMKF
ncbi:hypothetical protein H5P28_07355 [Ruficoccus amylovorans]|uniref:Uncharacterized protein n=1 Tax=Ruficoccus amylovorans TaxID=1804625 RepID=A0A842HES4_9BACT|nr:hypothetical protein [Ruficoccus amylovorans]MBC2594077.1 hypothetical protein [Ruficoccus amylovorans]